MGAGEDVVLHRELVAVLEVSADGALLRRRRGLGLLAGGLLQLQLGPLLLGACVLEPHLHHPLLEANVLAQGGALRHGGGLVHLKHRLHHLDLKSGHLSAKALVSPLSSAAAAACSSCGTGAVGAVGVDAAVGLGVVQVVGRVVAGVGGEIEGGLGGRCGGGGRERRNDGGGKGDGDGDGGRLGPSCGGRGRVGVLDVAHEPLHGVFVVLAHGALQVEGGGGVGDEGGDVV